MKHCRKFVFLFTYLVVCTTSGRIQAQEFKQFENITADGTSYHIFAKKGEATVQILVLGNIGSPGVYEIGTSIELDQLLALTGGYPVEKSPTTETRTTVRLFRKSLDQRELIYEAPIERMMAEPGHYPPLQDGDLLLLESTVRQRTPFTWREILAIVSSISSLVFIYDRITR